MLEPFILKSLGNAIKIESKTLSFIRYIYYSADTIVASDIRFTGININGAPLAATYLQNNLPITMDRVYSINSLL